MVTGRVFAKGAEKERLQAEGEQRKIQRGPTSLIVRTLFRQNKTILVGLARGRGKNVGVAESGWKKRWIISVCSAIHRYNDGNWGSALNGVASHILEIPYSLESCSSLFYEPLLTKEREKKYQISNSLIRVNNKSRVIFFFFF